ncbi:MAG: GNAT family N-acetyltransferase [Pirellulaceae bacterium]|nr:GNAT family N-acetyltransferase [Pirellulaceae bacterium]
MEKQKAFDVRPSTVNELPRILELNKAAVPAVNLLNTQESRNLFSQAEYFQCLWLDQEVIGFVIALVPGATYESPNYSWFESQYDQFLYVDRIVIDPSYQGNGFGHMLYDKLKKFAGQKQIPRITCEVNLRPKNENSLRFHQRYGFRQVGVQETEGGTKQVSLLAYEML